MVSNLILFPAATFIATAALLAYVVTRPNRSALLPALVAALVSILAWVGGMVIGELSLASPLPARIGALLHFAGVCGVAASFSIVAMRFARLSLMEDSGRAVSVALSVASALCFAMVASNPWHGAFGLALDRSFFVLPTSEWAGPLHPILIGWVYVCAGAGLGACVWRAARTRDRQERRRLVMVSLSGSAPMLGYALHAFGWLPLPPDVPIATLCLAFSSLIVVVGVTHYGFLDTSLLPLREVIAYLNDGLLLADLDGNVVEANPAAAALFARTRLDLVGVSLRELLLEVGDDGAVAASLSSPAAGDVRARRLQAPGDRTFEVSCGWVGGRFGAPIGCFAVLGDRTEQQRHQQLRHRAQRLESLGVLLGGLAHELNNPLAYVRSNLNHVSELADQLEAAIDASDSKLSDGIGELREVVSESLEGLMRIGAVVESTVELAPRGVHAPRRRVEINRTVLEALELARRATGSSAAIDDRLADADPALDADPERLKQAICNLLVNAMQAAPARDGRIRIATFQLDDRLVLTIENNGPDIPAAIRERVFDPFFTTRAPDRGMGLGLSIVHDIVREHDGEIDLTSSELGGARFALRFPRSLEAEFEAVA